MNPYEELVIGFDAREMVQDFRKEWSSQRQQEYLLNTEITKPLSTDVNIWTHVFDVEQKPLPTWVGPRHSLWDNLQNLYTFLDEQQVITRHWVIAITHFVDKQVKQEMKDDFRIIPEEIDTSWQILGFDVSDYYLLSGLTNVGRSDYSYTQPQKYWSERLNQYHLFENVEVAIDFSKESDLYVKEHSPFSVYGLYLISRSYDHQQTIETYS